MESIGTILRRSPGFGFATREEALWTCEKCGDTPAPRAAPAFNRYLRGHCACYKEMVARQRYEEERRARMERDHHHCEYTYAWLGGRWTDREMAARTFAGFTAARQQKAYDDVLDFADSMAGSLVLFGSFGTGKSHLLAALCNEMRARDHASRFTTAPKLFGAIQACINENTSYTSIIMRAINTPLLVIDDIDKAKWSEFREEIYFEILDSRATAGRPTAISTNQLDLLPKYVGGACASRLSIGQVACEMVGDDYRKEL